MKLFNFLRTGLFVLALAPFSCVHASNNQGIFTVWGSGNSSCGRYLAELSENQFAALKYNAWLAGYLTAFNRQTDGIRNIIQDTDLDGAIGWIRNYCQLNPTESFDTAVFKLTEFLRPKKRSDIPWTAPMPSQTTKSDEIPLPAWARAEAAAAAPSPKPNGPPNPFMALVPKDEAAHDALPPQMNANQRPRINQVADETVDVKYRGPVNLAPFACETIARSSFIERVCYDAKNAYMLIDLSGTWYHYCEIDQGTVTDLLAADSMGRFYNASIKGHFDCRTHRLPQY